MVLKLRPFPTDATRELHVLWHDGHALRVDGTQVGILKKTDNIRLRRLLKSRERGRLEPQIRLEAHGNLFHQPLEGTSSDKQLRRLLVPADLPEGNDTGAVPACPFDAANRGH